MHLIFLLAWVVNNKRVNAPLDYDTVLQKNCKRVVGTVPHDLCLIYIFKLNVRVPLKKKNY